MWQWLRSVGRRPPAAPPPVAPDDRTAAGEPPPWAADMAAVLQKSSRGQARVAARLEELEGKVEAGFADLRTSLAALARTSGRPAPSAIRWDALFDSIDLLADAAAAVDRQAQPGLGEGLDAIAARLAAFLEQESMVRVGARGMTLDGKVFRVVGTEEQPDLPEGVVARVVRAAVLRGEHLVREGQVITVRRAAATDR